MRFDSFAQPVNQRPMIATAGNKARPAIHQSLCGLRCSAGHAPPFSMLRRCLGHSIDRPLRQRMVHLKRVSEADREITHADEQQVHTLDGGDFIDTLNRLAIFDLQHKESLSISVPHVLDGIGKGVIGIGASAIEPAPPERWKAGPFHPLARLRGAQAMRNHDTVGAELEGAHGRGGGE